MPLRELESQKRPERGVFVLFGNVAGLLGILLLAGSFLNADHYRPWAAFHAEAIAVFGVVLLFFWLSTRQRRVDIPLGWLLWIVAAIAFQLIQWFFIEGQFIGDTLLALVFYGALLLGIVVGNALVKKKYLSVVELIFTALVISACTSSAIGLLQWLNLSEFLGIYAVHTAPDRTRAVGNMAQPNQLGTLLLMGTASSLFFFESRKIGRIAALALVFFLSLGVVITQSRTALLSVTAMGVFLLAHRKITRVKPRWILSWVVLLWFAALLLPSANAYLGLGATRQSDFTNSSGRWEMWHQVLVGISQSPWLGFGWNRTPSAHMAAAIELPGSFTYTYAHNIFLDIVVWYGVPMGLLLLGFLMWWLIILFFKSKSPVSYSAYAAIIPFCVHSFLEFPYAYAYFLVFVAIFVGMVEASVGGGAIFRVKNSIAIGFILTFISVGGVLVKEYLLIEEDFRVARFDGMRIGRVPEGYTPPDIHLLTQMKWMLQAARTKPTEGMSEQQVEVYKKAANRFSYGILSFRYAEALALNQQPEAAAEQMKVLRGMYGEGYYQAVVHEVRERLPQQPKLAALIN